MAANLNTLNFAAIERRAHELRREELAKVADEAVSTVARGWRLVTAIAAGAHKRMQEQKGGAFFGAQ